MVKTRSSLLFLSLLSFSALSQTDCIDLDPKSSAALEETVRNYMADSLGISKKINIGDPSFSPYEAHYDFVQANRSNCDSLVHIPIYRVEVKSRGNEDNWEFMLDINGAIVIVLQSTEQSNDWDYREY